MKTSGTIVIGPDEFSSARLRVSAWAEGIALIELVAEDVETQGRVRLDLSASQVHHLAAALRAAQLAAI